MDLSSQYTIQGIICHFEDHEDPRSGHDIYYVEIPIFRYYFYSDKTWKKYFFNTTYWPLEQVGLLPEINKGNVKGCWRGKQSVFLDNLLPIFSAVSYPFVTQLLPQSIVI